MEPFKNVFSPQLVQCLANHLAVHIANFDRPAFENAILKGLNTLEFKARAQLIADQVHLALPADFADRARILLAILHPDEEDHANQPSDENGICGWGVQPLTMVVGLYGVEDFDRSMQVLKEMTKRSSSEFGIRFFLLADQNRALRLMANWVQDPNRHVRRLVSEGTRPRLPWAMQLPQLIVDPSPMMPILEALRDDTEEYVRRSVANHLNDIAKDHPDSIARLAKNWMRGAEKNREKLVRHACRTLIKQGHPHALKAFGHSAPKIDLQNLVITTPQVVYGGSLKFSAIIQSTTNRPQSLVIDYLVHFKKANCQLAAKVFKWTKLTLSAGENRLIERAHPIRPITTRRYYAGRQGVSLRINGQDYGYEEFDLIMPDQPYS